MTPERINPATLRPPAEYYAHVTKAGNMVFVAGQAAVDKDGKMVGVGDITAQAEEVFRQLQECVRSAGTDLSHVVKLNTYLTRPEDNRPVGAVRSKYLRDAGLLPASTMVIVARLARPEMLIEIECIAVMP
ncbi:MAG: RidA family protein [Candidatus Binatia bacterium]